MLTSAKEIRGSHGVCADRVGFYECTCDAGYSGKDCDIADQCCQTPPDEADQVQRKQWNASGMMESAPAYAAAA